MKHSRNAMFNKGDGMETAMFSLTPSKDFLTRAIFVAINFHLPPIYTPPIHQRGDT